MALDFVMRSFVRRRCEPCDSQQQPSSSPPPKSRPPPAGVATSGLFCSLHIPIHLSPTLNAASMPLPVPRPAGSAAGRPPARCRPPARSAARSLAMEWPSASLPAPPPPRSPRPCGSATGSTTWASKSRPRRAGSCACLGGCAARSVLNQPVTAHIPGSSREAPPHPSAAGS